MAGRYDVIIIGAGVTGLAAAMYSARLGMKTLCLGNSQGSEMPLGGVITTTNIVENYPGFISLSGNELASKIKDHAASYQLVSLKEEKAEEVNKKNDGKFEVRTDNGKYEGKTIIFATGTKWRKLQVPGSQEFENKGVVYCALCDAPLFKNRVVAVIGGSDSAAKDALVAAEHAKNVYMIYRGREIRPEPINLQRIRANKKITVITQTNVTSVLGNKYVEKVTLDKPFKGLRELEVEGIFVAIGHIPLSEMAKKLGVNVNSNDEIIIDHKTSSTNIPGIFAAGDVADKPFKQAITGVAEGCTAAYSAFEYINKTAIVKS